MKIKTQNGPYSEHIFRMKKENILTTKARETVPFRSIINKMAGFASDFFINNLFLINTLKCF
jgi:hypothetical protein